MATSIQTTMLNLVKAVSDFANTDDEVVATVAYLVNSGKVRLYGNFAGAKIDLSAPRRVSPQRPYSYKGLTKPGSSVAA